MSRGAFYTSYNLFYNTQIFIYTKINKRKYMDKLTPSYMFAQLPSSVSIINIYVSSMKHHT